MQPVGERALGDGERGSARAQRAHRGRLCVVCGRVAHVRCGREDAGALRRAATGHHACRDHAQFDASLQVPLRTT